MKMQATVLNFHKVCENTIFYTKDVPSFHGRVKLVSTLVGVLCIRKVMSSIILNSL